jgi:hypothetical protein
MHGRVYRVMPFFVGAVAGASKSPWGLVDSHGHQRSWVTYQVVSDDKIRVTLMTPNPGKV